MARQSSSYMSYGWAVPHGSWNKEAWIHDEFHPNGVLADVTPMPGNTYTSATWPPRNRGRGESLYSDRRCFAKMRAVQVLQLRRAGYTWQRIARMLGFRDPSGPWRAVNRAISRIEWDKRRVEELRKYACR